ncbi:hypothetical protein BDQ17DRAFT_1329860 [Cyathus striatus]|nr:hypothetical protein BDQ17DRAFT_1329860 [Cyathus striatus]
MQKVKRMKEVGKKTQVSIPYTHSFAKTLFTCGFNVVNLEQLEVKDLSHNCSSQVNHRNPSIALRGDCPADGPVGQEFDGWALKEGVALCDSRALGNCRLRRQKPCLGSQTLFGWATKNNVTKRVTSRNIETAFNSRVHVPVVPNAETTHSGVCGIIREALVTDLNIVCINMESQLCTEIETFSANSAIFGNKISISGFLSRSDFELARQQIAVLGQGSMRRSAEVMVFLSVVEGSLLINLSSSGMAYYVLKSLFCEETTHFERGNHKQAWVWIAQGTGDRKLVLVKVFSGPLKVEHIKKNVDVQTWYEGYWHLNIACFSNVINNGSRLYLVCPQLDPDSPCDLLEHIIAKELKISLVESIIISLNGEGLGMKH